MMKYYLGIYVTLTIALHSVSSEVVNDDYDKIILSFIRSRCMKNSERLLRDYVTIQESILMYELRVLGAENKLDQEAEAVYHLVCTDLQPKLFYYIVPLTEALERCLNEEEKHIPNFISNFFNSTFKEHCKDGIKGIEEHRRLSNYLAKTNPTKNYTDCLTKASDIKNLEKPDFVLRKGSLCRFLENVRKCVSDSIQAHQDKNNYQFLEFHFNPIKALCDENVNMAEG